MSMSVTPSDDEVAELVPSLGNISIYQSQANFGPWEILAYKLLKFMN